LSCPDSDKSSVYRHVSLFYNHVVSAHLKSGMFSPYSDQNFIRFCYLLRSCRVYCSSGSHVCGSPKECNIGSFKFVLFFFVTVCCFGPSYINHEVFGHRHHHHLAKMELGHFLTRSVLTHLEIPVMVSFGFFCLLVCSFFSISVIITGHCLCAATNFCRLGQLMLFQRVTYNGDHTSLRLQKELHLNNKVKKRICPCPRHEDI